MERQVFMFFGIFLFIIILGINLHILKKHEEVTGDVVNYDSSMSRFVYKVYMSKEEVINSLKIMNIKDTLSCTFDFENSTILFKDLSSVSSHKKYFYEIKECDGFAILKLCHVSFAKNHYYMSRPFWGSRGQNNIPYMLNPFMVSKINAEIIPFSQYGN